MAQITTAAITQKYGVSARTIRRMITDGELPFVSKFPTKTGGYLFDSDVVDRVFAERIQDAEPVSA